MNSDKGSTVPKFKFDTLVDHCKVLDAEIARLRAELNQARLYEDNAVWHWQHDGEDFLESLTCPVVIPASQLRELLADRPTLPALMPWEDLQQLSDVPAVHEALQAFSEDATGNNGVFVVKAVLAAMPFEDAPESYTCIGKGGKYSFLGIATGAGTSKGQPTPYVYREQSTGHLFFREATDFYTRMEKLS